MIDDQYMDESITQDYSFILIFKVDDRTCHLLPLTMVLGSSHLILLGGREISLESNRSFFHVYRNQTFFWCG